MFLNFFYNDFIVGRKIQVDNIKLLKSYVYIGSQNDSGSPSSYLEGRAHMCT
jgi:hypothetical protein